MTGIGRTTEPSGTDCLRPRYVGSILADPHDLKHKAVGWMLREVGKPDQATLEGFLKTHQRAMPRTMLRYAIGRFPEELRRAFLQGTLTA